MLQRFAKMQDESFRRGVSRHVRQRLEGRVGRYIDDSSPTACGHGPAEPMAEANQRLYIDLNAGLLLGVVMIKETAWTMSAAEARCA